MMVPMRIGSASVVRLLPAYGFRASCVPSLRVVSHRKPTTSTAGHPGLRGCSHEENKL